MPFLETDTEQVNSAGRRTSATSGEWQTWAVQAEEAMRGAPAGAGSGVVTAAAEEYLGDWNGRLHFVARRVDELGTNTSSGAVVVDNVDTESAGFLSAFAETTVAEQMHALPNDGRPLFGEDGNYSVSVLPPLGSLLERPM
jgi:hypothetical protein